MKSDKVLITFLAEPELREQAKYASEALGINISQFLRNCLSILVTSPEVGDRIKNIQTFISKEALKETIL